MDRLDSKITFSDPFGTTEPQVFDFCHEVNIDSSYDNLTDQASVIIPKRIRYTREDGTAVDAITRGENPLFKIGDKAAIEVGYNGSLASCFRGYISSIKQKFPVEFKLEDPVYLLKQNAVTVSLQNPQLSELLGEVIPSGVEYEITAEQNLGDFRVNNASAAAVLDELRKKHGIYSFFRDRVLYVGLSVVSELQTVHEFNFFTPQIIDAESLKYIDASERRIKVICKSIDRSNNTYEVTAGDPNGETRTFYFNNLTNIELEEKALSLVDELRYSGYEGYFTIFASPIVKHGDIVELINPEIPEQSGGYIVTRVVTRFGWSIGGRQDVYIKQKIYDLDLDGNQIEITKNKIITSG